MTHALTWIEISEKNLIHNVKILKKTVGAKTVFCAVVKANAYGHGLRECAPVMVKAGADWLGVNALFEAMELKKIGIKTPIYIMGYVPENELSIATEEGFHMVVYNEETLQKLARICKKLRRPVFTHLKLETGIYRQGILDHQLDKFLEFYKKNPDVRLEGASMHFANLEDTNDHSYGMFQLKNFAKMLKKIHAAGFHPPYIHAANTAATILFPKTHFTMVRAGIGNYGLWPSNKTYLAAIREKKNIDLRPVMTWKTKIAQIKNVAKGTYIGYGCTHKTIRDTRLAVLPVGYYDGYDRGLSNLGHVLIHGRRARILGRVCMNIIMVDVSDIPEARREDEAVLLGQQGSKTITADQMANWLGTINYEVATKINEKIERKVIGS